MKKPHQYRVGDWAIPTKKGIALLAKASSDWPKWFPPGVPFQICRVDWDCIWKENFIINANATEPYYPKRELWAKFYRQL